ncbi:MAG: hypothetical protein MHPSP_001527 [Paramarteilia canceri]
MKLHYFALKKYDLPEIIIKLINKNYFRTIIVDAENKCSIKYCAENAKFLVKTTEIEKDYPQITRLEAKIWSALYTFLGIKEVQEKYSITSQRKNFLCSLMKYENDFFIMQLPPLKHLFSYLSKLSMSSSSSLSSEKNSTVSSHLIIDQSTSIREVLAQEFKTSKQSILNSQRDIFIRNPVQHTNSFISSLGEVFAGDSYTTVARYQDDFANFKLDEESANISDKKSSSSPCQICKRFASKKCSKCKEIWYCSQECQSKDWENHKIVCSI